MKLKGRYYFLIWAEGADGVRKLRGSNVHEGWIKWAAKSTERARG